MNRVLPSEAFATLADYVAAGGGKGLDAARTVDPDVVIDEVLASGLRGRGGAGFPTGVKWRTVRSYASPLLHTTVVVNAAEGEPGTFKDRTILRCNPYAVLEGALIAALAVDAKGVVVATRRRSPRSSYASVQRSTRSPQRDGPMVWPSRWSKGRRSICSVRRRPCSK